MGVTGLWPLLEPVGRRVNIETLAGKKVAIGEFFVRRRLDRISGAALHVRAALSLVFYVAAWRG